VEVHLRFGGVQLGPHAKSGRAIRMSGTRRAPSPPVAIIMKTKRPLSRGFSAPG
jgi:hypothetical protein